MSAEASPGSWADHAACRGHLHVMVVSERNERLEHNVGYVGYEARVANARALCHTCPVLTECEAWAMTEPDPARGLVAGGLTPQQRRQRRRGEIQRRQAARRLDS